MQEQHGGPAGVPGLDAGQAEADAVARAERDLLDAGRVEAVAQRAEGRCGADPAERRPGRPGGVVLKIIGGAP
ncbi:hypothetical protein O1M54_46325 [Streptomyces diastatochromogenes]|nr:hypothetical protein [Streptomyces diastatochromogenes]